MKGPTETLSAHQLVADEVPPTLGIAPVFSETASLPPAMTLGSSVTIGRDAPASLIVEDPKISRLHAEISLQDEEVRIRDLGSRNGMRVDGQFHAPNSFAHARVGSTIRLGNTLFRIVEDSAAFRTYGMPMGTDFVAGPSLLGVRESLREAKVGRTPVLIEGETGTGKEKIAQAIHKASGRSGSWVAINCAALPRDLLESELFGHSKGAFSGSVQSRKGVFRAAHEGTLLLDEIGELPLDAQAKLLRVLETGEVRTVGEDREYAVDVRLIAATHRDLEQMVASGEFRADLFHRIAALRISIPPLRDRLEDVPLLVQSFLEGTSMKVSADAVERLMASSWPGNVRELRNVIDVAVSRAHARGASRIESEHLPETIRELSPRPFEWQGNEADLRARLEASLRERQGVVSRVARDLNIRRATLYQLFERFDLDPSAFRPKK